MFSTFGGSAIDEDCFSLQRRAEGERKCKRLALSTVWVNAIKGEVLSKIHKFPEVRHDEVKLVPGDPVKIPANLFKPRRFQQRHGLDAPMSPGVFPGASAIVGGKADWPTWTAGGLTAQIADTVLMPAVAGSPKLLLSVWKSSLLPVGTLFWTSVNTNLRMVIGHVGQGLVTYPIGHIDEPVPGVNGGLHTTLYLPLLEDDESPVVEFVSDLPNVTVYSYEWYGPWEFGTPEVHVAVLKRYPLLEWLTRNAFEGVGVSLLHTLAQRECGKQTRGLSTWDLLDFFIQKYLGDIPEDERLEILTQRVDRKRRACRGDDLLEQSKAELPKDEAAKKLEADERADHQAKASAAENTDYEEKLKSLRRKVLADERRAMMEKANPSATEIARANLRGKKWGWVLTRVTRDDEWTSACVKELCPPGFTAWHEKASQCWKVKNEVLRIFHSRAWVSYGVEGAALFVARDAWRSYYKATNFAWDMPLPVAERLGLCNWGGNSIGAQQAALARGV